MRRKRDGHSFVEEGNLENELLTRYMIKAYGGLRAVVANHSIIVHLPLSSNFVSTCQSMFKDVHLHLFFVSVQTLAFHLPPLADLVKGGLTGRMDDLMDIKYFDVGAQSEYLRNVACSQRCRDHRRESPHRYQPRKS